MNSPHTNCIPNRYEINSDDDRRLTGHDSQAYFAIATALDAIEPQDGVGIYAETYRAMPPAARKAIGMAERALRRAAWVIVMHAEEGLPNG